MTSPIRVALLDDWYRRMREAKSRAERQKINRVFRDIAKAVKNGLSELEGTAPKRNGWAALVARLPPPLDPIGIALYHNLMKGDDTECPICRLTSAADMVERGCAGCLDESACVAETLKVLYRIEAGFDSPDTIIEKLQPVFEKYKVDPNKFEIG